MPKPPGLPAKGALIRELRRELGIGPTELAKRLRITYGHLANIENGHAKASAPLLTKIATALGRRTEDLIAVPQESATARPEPIPRPPGPPKDPETDRPPNKPDVAVA